MLLDRLPQHEALLRAAHQEFSAAAQQLALPYAAEWLLDNFYVVEQALRLIREDLPYGYYRQLPKLARSALADYPRVFALAAEIVRSGAGHVDLDWARRFVVAYQHVAPLTIGELWALPTMLRFVMLERLVQVTARICGYASGPYDMATEATGLHEEPLPDDTAPSCIRGLRLLAAEDWKAFFEEVSSVEQVLRAEPAGIYPLMDFETRDCYRRVIEELAQATQHDEIVIAQEAVRLAACAADGRPESPVRAQHVGYFLLDVGREQLEAVVGYQPPWPERLRRRVFRHASFAYLSSIAVLSGALVAALLGLAAATGGAAPQLVTVGLLALVPAITAVTTLVNWIITHTVPPRVLPKLDFHDGIPSRYHTMVVMPALLTDAEEVAALLRQIELHQLSNADPQLTLALLTDFVDGPLAQMPGDDELLAQAVDGIRALNARYPTRTGGPFYLFHRERVWNPAEDCWMGWERKRGKLQELNVLLGGAGTTGYTLQIGDLAALPTIRYVITLDADTVLPHGSARHMVATMAHPLNHAEFAPSVGALSAGYSVLQPRVAVKPTSANRSLFTRIFAGDGTLDLYTRAVSDVYQDLFGAGIYVGKGIYDVAAFERSLNGRVPENALLSHDLFEGIHGRVGLLTDTVLLESYPPTYLAYASRLHRWVRGDWQLLPWLLRQRVRAGDGTRPNNLSAIDRWKILDNLGRSLLTPALLLLLIAGWLWLPGGALLWTLLGLLLSAAPFMPAAAGELAQALRHIHSPSRAAPSLAVALRWLLVLAFLPYEGLILLFAISSTLVRLLITRRGLLSWAPAALIARQFGASASALLFWRQMAGAPALAAAAGVAIGLARPAALPVAAPLLVAWALSPLIAFRISQPARPAQPPISDAQRQRLRSLARHTWLYFETFVGPEDNWLPPDHFQEAPRGLVAHRTSPTNIGLHLLATLSAYDLGYLDLLELSVRLGDTFDGMERLERYRGHIVNWSDTRTLQSLSPRYVSTVDSGNLAASLLALRQGCEAIIHGPIYRAERWHGLLDTLGMLDEAVSHIQASDPMAPSGALHAQLAEMRRRVLVAAHGLSGVAAALAELHHGVSPEIDRLLVTLIDAGAPALDATTIQALRTWAQRLHHHIAAMRRELDLLQPWLLPLSQPPVLLAQASDGPIVDVWQELVDALPAQACLEELPAVCAAALAQLARIGEHLIDGAAPAEQLEEARAWCGQLMGDLTRSRGVATQALRDYHALCERAETLFRGMDFGFLFDQRRQVFHIGYNIDTATMDANYYDLLASEARITSLVAIAKGDVPQRHWLHLGRPFAGLDNTRVLLSWSGTMFEYLMPLLLLRHDPATLLGQSCTAAVDRQIAYGREHGVPWGASESGYYRFDADLNYQYQAFGVPLLGFKRGLAADLVVAPYASLLALPLRPLAVLQNITRLVELGMLGRYGFYEAVDYTPTRMPRAERHALVQSYMVHHQAMILLSLDNLLHGAPMVERFHADPRIQSVELLLYEEPPRFTPLEAPPVEADSVTHPALPLVSFPPWRVRPDALLPQVLALSNGRYSLAITSAGGGYSQWQGIDLTRWRADTTLDDWGSWIYIQDRENDALWSACYQPVAAAPTQHEVHFSAHLAAFRRHDHAIVAHTELAIAPDDDVEIRRISLTNDSDRPRRLLLSSYAEVVLVSQAVDQRHPAFNKLFIESEYLSEMQTLLYRRRPRAATEQPIFLAHSLVVEPGQPPLYGYECDRAQFLGRGRTSRAPAALVAGSGVFTCTAGATLDPIMALGQEIELAPRTTVRLAFLTLAAGSRREAEALIERYRAWPIIDRALEQAARRAELELRRLNVTAQVLEQAQQLLSALLYPHSGLRASPETLAANRAGQSRLWPYAISGDEPILLARIGDEEALGLVQELLRAHALWRHQQQRIDLVFVNQQVSCYAQELQGQLMRLIDRSGGSAWLNLRGGIFVLNVGQIAEGDLPLLESAARVIVDGARGALAAQLARLYRPAPHLPALQPILPGSDNPEPTPPLHRPSGLCFDNGLGGFSSDGCEYVIYLVAGQDTPAPWVNVIATPDFGFLTSEAGSGCTWAGNSGEHRLTPWRNDPVGDQPGEALYIRDEETGQFWSPTPLPARDAEPYLIRHGAGYSVYAHHSHGLKQEVRLFTAPDAPVKVTRLRLENCWGHTRRITVTCYAEWVLGVNRPEQQQYTVPEFDADSQALLARNPYSVEFGERVAFMAASKPLHGLTASRAEFLGRMGSLSHPAALDRIGLMGTVEPGIDPCAALQLHIDLPPGAVEELFFLLGE
ncbi:MAG: cellobiose phosphorylase, partial [Chloroflexales bacterium]|nr:cellobiose phosphorylase [Chloroflexales bacterium]